MVEINKSMRKLLKKPLGKLYKNIESAKKDIIKYNIIAVGDVITIKMLAKKLKITLAIFDYQTKRKKISSKLIAKLKKSFPLAVKYTNKAGTISDKLIKDAKKLLKKGGGIRIIGEEDLTAIAFVLAGNSKNRIIYGQPNKGIVVVNPMKIKRKIKKYLSAASFGHKVKGNE